MTWSLHHPYHNWLLSYSQIMELRETQLFVWEHTEEQGFEPNQLVLESLIDSCMLMTLLFYPALYWDSISERHRSFCRELLESSTEILPWETEAKLEIPRGVSSDCPWWHAWPFQRDLYSTKDKGAAWAAAWRWQCLQGLDVNYVHRPWDTSQAILFPVSL